MRLGCLSLRRLFCREKMDIIGKQQSNVVKPSQQIETTPVHLRPYDKKKYEVPMKTIKKNSGYALLNIEPFPRSRIMKICYNILEQVRIGFPEDCSFRLLYEQRTKYIMKLVDQNDDVQTLENIFGVEQIELVIQNLAIQFEVIDYCRQEKVWEIDQEELKEFYSFASKHPNEKNPNYKRPERQLHNFMDAF